MLPSVSLWFYNVLNYCYRNDCIECKLHIIILLYHQWNICNNQVAQWYRIHVPMQERQGTQVWFLGWEDPLEKEMATHSSILAWWIPWTEETGELQSMGSQESDKSEHAVEYKLHKIWYHELLSCLSLAWGLVLNSLSTTICWIN